MNLQSTTALLNALKKNAAGKEAKGEWKAVDLPTNLPNQKSIMQHFEYPQRNWARDTMELRCVTVNAIYKEEKLRFVRVAEYTFDDDCGINQKELFRYIDTAYAAQVNRGRP